MRNRIKNETSTNIPTESNPSGGVRNQNDPTSYPSGAEIKDTLSKTQDVLSKPSAADTPSKTDIKVPSPRMPKPNMGTKPYQTNSYDPFSNKGILEISEKILKKNFNLGEEGYDIARDMGKVPKTKDKKDATTMPPSKEMEKTRKVNKGPSALEIVKKKYKGQIMDVDKKKKDKK